MATTVASLQAVLDLEHSRFDRGLHDSDHKFRGFGSSVGRHALGLAKVGVGAAVSVSAAFAGMAIYKGGQRAIAIDDANRKLEGLGYNAQQVATITDNALKSVLGTPYSLAEALTVASTAMAAGVGPGKELSKYLGTVADTAAIAGTNMTDVGAILNKATANVRVHADVLNQLADRGLPVFSWLQKQYRVTGEELTGMVKKGEVDSKTLMKVIRDNIGGASQKAGEGIRGSFENLMTAIARLGDAFVGPIFGSIPKFFTFLRDEVDKATEAIKPLGDAFGRFADTYGPQLQHVLKVVVGGAFQFVADLVGSVVSAIRDHWDGILDVLRTVWSFIKERIVPVILGLRDIAVATFQRIAKVIEENRPALERIAVRMGELVKVIWTVLKPVLILVFEQILPRVLDRAIKIIDLVSGAIEKVVGWFKTARDVGQHVWGAVTGFIDKVVDRIQGAIDKVRSFSQWVQNMVSKVAGPLEHLRSLFSFDITKPHGLLTGDGVVGVASNPGGLVPQILDDLGLANSMGLMLTSGYRPGAITSTGNPSLHGVGKAIDVAGSETAMRSFFLREAARGASTGLAEIIHSPYWWHPGVGITAIPATAGTVLADHYNHVHVGTYDQGGWLPPRSATWAINRTNQWEPVGPPGRGSGVILNYYCTVGDPRDGEKILRILEQWERKGGRM